MPTSSASVRMACASEGGVFAAQFVLAHHPDLRLYPG
jgi:hypothetical protein